MWVKKVVTEAKHVGDSHCVKGGHCMYITKNINGS